MTKITKELLEADNAFLYTKKLNSDVWTNILSYIDPIQCKTCLKFRFIGDKLYIKHSNNHYCNETCYCFI